MKKILGLDLGTNSIGWAVVNADEISREDGSKYLKPTGISNAGSRIIPMSADILGDFEKGNSISQTAERTRMRMTRRLHERAILRRERLLRVLNLMGFLPKHFADKVNRYGKFTDDSEPKIAWRKNADGKMEFIFQDAFNEMLEEFRKSHPELVANGKKIPYDWTIYYLRKKALTQRISKEEFSWLLLQFNQKRGYNQLRGEEEEEKTNESLEIIAAKISSVEKKEKDKKYDKYWYEMSLDNGLTYRATFYNDVSSWKNETKEFVLKTTILKDGSKKEELSFMPSLEEIERMDAQKKGKMYAKIKLRTEKNVKDSGKTIGCYIYDSLINNPNQKIIGKLVRTVERKFYKDELRLILEKQQSLIPALQNKELYKDCIEELYPNNEAHRNSISKPDFINLFLNDILFYQRPLKSKKSLISNCPYEYHFFIDKNTGEKKKSPIKCIAKSNPLFQEFRLWQFVQNLKFYSRENNKDVTLEFLPTKEDLVKLFDWLNERASIKQESLLKNYFKKTIENQQQYPYRWNYVEDKEYPCNKTRAAILAKLDKKEKKALSSELIYKIWHLLYSVNTQAEINAVFDEKKKGNAKGLYAELRKIFSDATIAKIKNIKFEETDYGSYSEKAIKKLLPLMRMGKYWAANNIDPNTLSRIDKITTGEYDETIRNRVRDLSIGLRVISDFSGLPVWLASYIVYDRHSEAKEIQKWEKPEDIDLYLKNFKQHSLRNPIVEQVITETMRTVHDIWKHEGQIDEIHVELGRDIKNPADKRKKMTEKILQNENTNLRIKAMLMEFMNPEMGIENVRPYSPSQQDILRIYEENALENLSKDDKEFDFISRISKQAQPSKSDIIRYKCWLEQKYCSPYTGQMIPLAKLFTTAYEIEHIIPQSRYFDDSFNNKVICEAEVNKLKDRQLGHEFISEHHGEKIQLSQGGTVEILSVENYEKFVRDHYTNNRIKMRKLLLDDIPDDFIERQLNDSRYISKVVKGLLSNIVREKNAENEYEQEATSKNLISCNGTITDRLKKDWGLNDVWNSIILPRFERLNKLIGQISTSELIDEFKKQFEKELSDYSSEKRRSITTSFVDFYKSLDNKEQRKIIDNVMKRLPTRESFLSVNNEGHIIPNMPLELQKGFNKKRIDHRHHAMDAIVIACTTRDHINLLNNEASHLKYEANRYQLQRKLRRFEKTIINGKEKFIAKEFLKPWDTFTADSKQILKNIIVSFKQDQRVINKTVNRYESYKDEMGNLRIEKDGKPKKDFVKQEKGDSWAIRKSMHKATIFGEIKNLRLKKDVKLSIAIKDLDNIADSPIKQKIKDLLIQGKDVKSIECYFAENKKEWPNFNSSKIPLYYFSKDTKDRYFATRFGNDLVSIFNNVTDEQKAKNIIEKITDTGIQYILLAHLAAKNNKPELAFSPDGIDEMNRNIVNLNKGKFHQPIFKVRIFEKSAKKFAIGQTGNKSAKFAEADDGTNLFFAILNVGNKRSYLTIPFNESVDCQKLYGHQWKENLETYLKEKKLVEKEAKLQFVLSPNDLVYLPTEEELNNKKYSYCKDRIYKFVDASGTIANFIPCTYAKAIFSMTKDDQKKIFNCIKYNIQNEIGVGSRPSKSQTSFNGEMIKEICIPIKVDRLGNIVQK